MSTKEIIYPFFLECCSLAPDIFWNNVFEDLAYGKSPYGTYIHKDFLCCGFKKKEFSYKIERKDPQVLFDDIYKLLNKKLGLLSHKEKIKKRLIFYQTESQLKDNYKNWENIRKQNMKNLLYKKYVIDLKKKYSLDKQQARYLWSAIFVATICKAITSKNITYSSNKIQNIEGVKVSAGKIEQLPKIKHTKSNTSSQSVPVKKNMSDNWEKYLTTFKKSKFCR